MRVISGIYKRRRFDVPHTFKARPTTDFAKENLFNVLCNNYLDFEEGVTALDLFAGTGSISIELVSRGCDRVISIEKDPQHLAFISQIMREVKTDKCFPMRADVFKYIERCHEQFDFIFHYTIKPVIYGGWAARKARIRQISVITGLGYTFIRKGWINRVAKLLYRFSLRSAKEVWFLNQPKTVFTCTITL